MASINGTNGMGSANNLYKIETGHYDGDFHTGSTLDVISKGAPYIGLRSVYGTSPNYSYAHIPGIGLQKWENLNEHNLTYHAVGDRAVIRPNAAGPNATVSAEDLEKYGAMVVREESMEVMDRWLAVKSLLECVPHNKEVGLFELAEHKIDYAKLGMTDVNLYVKDFSGMVPINKFGLYLSLIANAEQDFRDVIFANDLKEIPGFNKETLALLESLIGKGFSPREIEAIGVMKLDGPIARAYCGNETATLVASKDIGEKASRIAEAYGLTGAEAAKFVKRAIWYHEMYHVCDKRKGVSATNKEIDVGEFLAEFFDTRASMLEGKIAEYYKSLGRFNKVYAQKYRDGTIKVSDENSLMSMVNSLISKYASEAENMELTGEEAKEYIANKLEQELKTELGENGENSELEANAEKDLKYDGKAKSESDSEEPAEGDLEAKAAETDCNPAADSDGDSEGGDSGE